MPHSPQHRPPALSWPQPEASDLERLREVAQTARRSFELALRAGFGASNTRGACLYGSILLWRLIERFAAFDARVVGGGPLAYGWRASNGVAHGHYWVLATHRATGARVVADITADQFGVAAVVVLPEGEARAWEPDPGDRAHLDAVELLAELQAECREPAAPPAGR